MWKSYENIWDHLGGNSAVVLLSSPRSLGASAAQSMVQIIVRKILKRVLLRTAKAGRKASSKALGVSWHVSRHPWSYLYVIDIFWQVVVNVRAQNLCFSVSHLQQLFLCLFFAVPKLNFICSICDFPRSFSRLCLVHQGTRRFYRYSYPL